ncbi:MAG: 6-phosphofructokinase, partial [Myxococcales bacterium]
KGHRMLGVRHGYRGLLDGKMNTIVEACDRIGDTASAHGRTFIIEVMGCDCGYLAMTSAIASGANMVLFPEAARTEEELVSSMVKTGNVAIRALLAGEHRKMVSWLPPMDLPEGAGTRSPADPYCYLIDLPTVLAATKRLLEGQSPLARWRTTAFDDLEDVFLL